MFPLQCLLWKLDKVTFLLITTTVAMKKIRTRITPNMDTFHAVKTGCFFQLVTPYMMLELHAEANVSWFFQQFQFYNKKNWKKSEIWVVDASCLFFSQWLKHLTLLRLYFVVILFIVAFSVLDQCFNYSNSLSKWSLLFARTAIKLEHSTTYLNTEALGD